MEWKSSFGKWTPVYVELPEDEETVLISTNHNHMSDGSGDWKAVEFGYYNHDGDKLWTSLAIDGKCEIFENVVAWMPLPKPFVDKNLESEEN